MRRPDNYSTFFLEFLTFVGLLPYILGVPGFLSVTQIAKMCEKIIQQLWFRYY
jgi:hypothetical protein